MLGGGSMQHTVPFQAPCHVCNTFDSRIEVPAFRKIRSLWSSSAWGQPELYEAWSQKIMKWNKIKFKSVGHSAVYRTRLCKLSHLECIVAQHLCYLCVVYMHVGICTSSVCRRQRSVLDVFLDCSPPFEIGSRTEPRAYWDYRCVPPPPAFSWRSEVRSSGLCGRHLTPESSFQSSSVYFQDSVWEVNNAQETCFTFQTDSMCGFVVISQFTSYSLSFRATYSSCDGLSIW